MNKYLTKLSKAIQKNNRIKRSVYFSFILLVCYSCSVQGQSLSPETVYSYNSEFKKANGIDHNLINGYQYIKLYLKANGHAFFDKDEFLPGKIIINNKLYNDVYLKYDILNQNVILLYKNSFGGNNQIVLHNHAINQFELKNKIFVNLLFPEIGNKYFQVISNSTIKCYYLWYKEIRNTSWSIDSYYEYSDQRKKTYLLINGELLRYRGNISFIKLFPKKKQEYIKQYIKTNAIKLKKASDKTVNELIIYCENLIIEG
ncbi:MAG: hypothetical protein JXB17_09670 [Bacteroidales bacterium]|nr:hypothetical protein [Bacteroidales bacterium]